MNRAHFPIAAAASLFIALGACGKKAETGAPEAAAPADSAAPEPDVAAPVIIDASTWSDARADLVGPAGEAMGAVSFRDGLGGVLVRVEATGLTPGWHGIHLHMVGDCSDGADGFKASGGHINPDNVEHGLLNPNGSHRADIPNLFAGADGVAEGEFFRAGLHLQPSEESAARNGPFPLMDDDGFAVIIHESPDDHVTQPIGGAGARVACAAVK
ncbi:MAG: superoxide dismutase family protein [Parvularculaceae bacterium]|nr:superoxide dismutase family protein [Parvularculaceae bacterium]